MRSKLLLGAGLVFGSGVSALLYQTAWLREFRLIFGSTTAATAAVLAIFMAGLGIGSAILGKRAEASKQPLRFYATLELMIAASAALTPILIWLSRTIYIAAGGTAAMGLFVSTCLRLVLTAVVLAVPTLLMGGTLPAMARFAVNEEDTGRRGFALLYGLNTLGAVAGAGLGTFYLLERFGNWTTLLLSCLINATVASLAWLLARNESQPPKEKRVDREKSTEPAAPFRLVLGAAATTGFVFLLMELVWYRMLSPILGGTAFTFGLILAIALFGVGLGGVLYSLGQEKYRPTLNGFACSCAMEALCLAVPFALGDRLALAAILLQPLTTFGFYGRVIGWVALCSIIVLPAAIVAGIQFPMLIGLLGKGREKVGAQAGAAYAWNTGGAIAGSLAGGFGFIPLFTAPHTWQIVVVALVLCAFVSTTIAQRTLNSPLRCFLPALVGAAAILLVFLSTGPTAVWRHSVAAIIRMKKYDQTPNDLRALFNAARRDILWEADGRETSVGVSKSNSLAFVVNGKCDGNVKGDAGTQVMTGLIGPLVHPSPKTAMVIGLGTGSTAGWIASVPSIDRVDVVEIEPTIVKFAAECAAINQDALHNPKLHLQIADAREVLLTNRGTYDLIVSEPSNPYRAGVATLFTREYYEAAAKRLRPGGLFVQWMQAYEVDMKTVQIFYATLSSVFPHIETWQSATGDLMLVASDNEIVYDIPSLRERITQEPFKSGLAMAWQATDLEGAFSHYVGNEKFAHVVVRQIGVPINTDDQTLLEFAFARNARATRGVGFERLRQDAKAFQADRPSCNGELNWESVQTQRLGMFVAWDEPPTPNMATSDEDRLLIAAFKNYSDGYPAQALRYWNQLRREPVDLSELMMVAECLADQGDAKALEYVEQLKRIEPSEAIAIEARFLWRQNRFDEAGNAMVKALQSFHTDPWPMRSLMARTLNLAPQIAAGSRDRNNVMLMYRALEKPFAVYNIDDERMSTLLTLGLDLDLGRADEHTLEALQAPEPNVPWQLAFLKIRSACYRHFQHPLADKASRDLAEFVKNDNDLTDTKDSPTISPQNQVARVGDQ